MPFAVTKLEKGLRDMCRTIFLDEIITPIVKNNWMVLVLDSEALEIMNACCRKEEILARNIVCINLVDNVSDNLTPFEVIYLLRPTTENMIVIIENYVGDRFKGINFVFLSTVHDYDFSRLAESIDPEVVHTFFEIELLFTPYESQVFLATDPNLYHEYFDSFKLMSANPLDLTAHKIATVFYNLGQFPLIRYRSEYVQNLILAEKVYQKLKNFPQQLPRIDPCSGKTCELLILDRGFDCISPLLREFTFQAMVYDILDVKDDTYEYIQQTGVFAGDPVVVPLTEDDSFWCQLRHEHIAKVAAIIQKKIETDAFTDRASFMRRKNIHDLGESIKAYIVNKRNHSFYSYRYIANECMKAYCGGINVVTQVEQDLAMGTTPDHKRLKEPLPTVLKILSDEKIEIGQKLRIFLLYIFYLGGIKKERFNEILKLVDIPFDVAAPITNVLHMDIDLFKPGKCYGVKENLIEMGEDRATEAIYKQSRWIPLLKFILRQYLCGTLSKTYFPFLNANEPVHQLMPIRRPWCPDNKERNNSQLVIYIAGGATYSELRVVYEIMKEYTGWSIYIGSDFFLTPDKFFERLSELRYLVTAGM